MTNKCEFCSEKIAEDELGKLKGTIVKIKGKGEDEKNKLKFVCSECQKKYQDATKARLIKSQ